MQAHTYTHAVEPVSQGSHHNYSSCSSAPAGYASPECKRLVNLTEISGLHVYVHMSN